MKAEMQTGGRISFVQRLGHPRKQRSQFGQAERFVKVGSAYRFEESERVTSNRVPRGKDHLFGLGRPSALELLVELPAAEPGHPQVRDNQIEAISCQPIASFLSVRRLRHRMPP